MNHAKSSLLKKALLPLLVLGPVVAQAHPGHDGFGAGAGLQHIAIGGDHLLSLLAVGLWAGQQGDASRRHLPLAFTAILALGWITARLGFIAPGAEQAVLLATLLFGVLVAAAVRLPFAVSASLVGLFAFFHGQAHAPHEGDVSYTAGFFAATLAVQLIGLGFAAALQQKTVLRFAGAGLAVAAFLASLS